MDGNAKTLFKKFCINGPFIGLKYFYLYPDKFSRCFWTISMIAVTYMACLLTLLLYRRFAEMPTRITIESQNEPTANFPYPAITICSPNQVAISSINHLKKTFIDGNISANFNFLFPKLLGYYEYIHDFNESDLQVLQEAIDLNRYSIPELLAAVAQKCDNFLKLCFFENKLVDCGKLFKPILTAHGLCCIFNSWYSFKKRNEKNLNYRPKNGRYIGLVGGLTVVTDYEPMDAVDRTLLNAGSTRIMFTDGKEFPADDESTLQCSSVEAYFMIEGTYTYCSEEVKGLPPWTCVRDYPHLISVCLWKTTILSGGGAEWIRTRRHTKSSVELGLCKGRKCLFEDESRLRYFFQYRNNDCDHACFAQALENSCGCLMPYLPYVFTERVCNISKIKCIQNAKLEVTDSHVLDCNCPRDCESRRYKVHTSVGNLMGLPYMIVNPYSDIQFNKSTSLLHLFFRNPVYTKKKQETVMSIISFSSNLGGVFGLCIGCSVFSVYEIIFYTYYAVKNKIKEKLAHLK